MSRHRKGSPVSPPSRRPQSTPPASTNGGAPPCDATAALLQLRAAIAALRQDVNVRLDALDRQVEALLPHHPADPPRPTVAGEAAPAPSEPVVARGPAAGVKVGDQVYVPSLGGTYTVVEAAADGRTFKVQANQLRVHVRVDEMWRLDEDGGTRAPAAKAARPALNPTIAEIDLHGYTEDEALVTLELFLHHAFASRTPRVRIIHGKGNGILRAAVRREMARNPLVKAVDVAPHFRGDDGVTLAELDL